MFGILGAIMTQNEKISEMEITFQNQRCYLTNIYRKFGVIMETQERYADKYPLEGFYILYINFNRNYFILDAPIYIILNLDDRSVLKYLENPNINS